MQKKSDSGSATSPWCKIAAPNSGICVLIDWVNLKSYLKTTGMSLSQELYSDPFCVAQSSTKTGQDEPVGAASVLCPSANLHPLPLAAQTEGSVHFVSEKNINNEFFRR